MSEAILEKFLHEVVPYRIGSRVRVKPGHKYASDWPDVCVVVGMTWEYQKGSGQGVSIAIATDDEIQNNYGSCDGWSVDDLVPAGPTP